MSRLRRGIRLAAVSLCVVAVSGCSSTGHERTEDVHDPLEKVNRPIGKFNRSLDRYIVRYIVRAYVTVTPTLLRQSLGNVITNLGMPINAANQLLQGSPRDAWNDTRRFTVNTLVGAAGVVDVATELDIPMDDEDFGQTLGVWGLPPGPYLELPFFGPSTLRDAPSRLVSTGSKTLFLNFIGAGFFSVPQRAIGLLDERTEANDKLEKVYEEALDPYVFIREAYLQRREFLIRDGETTEAEDEDLAIDIPLDIPAADDPQ